MKLWKPTPTDPAHVLAAIRRALRHLRGDTVFLRRDLENLRARAAGALVDVAPDNRALLAELRFLEAFLDQMLAEEVAELEVNLEIGATRTAATLAVEELGA